MRIITRSSQNKNMIKLKQLPLIVQIQNNINFHDKLLAQLKDKNHAINKIANSQTIKRFQKLFKNNLKKQSQLLQDYFNQFSQQDIKGSKISQQQKQQCENRILKLLRIIHLFYKIQQTYSQKQIYLAFYNKIIQYTDNFQIITTTIQLLLETSFEKIQKQYYQNIYFLLNHLDIYNLRNSSIKNIYELGETIKNFQFNYLHQKKQNNIIIKDFYSFIIDNKLQTANYRIVAKFILNKFNLQIQNNSITQYALFMKIKIYLKSVQINHKNEIKNIADSVVKAIIYSNVMYCYIDLYLISAQIIQQHNIPNIFVFPPDYSSIFKQLLQILFIQKSQKDTHLIIIKAINQILQIPQRSKCSYDIVSRFIDSSPLIFKYLNYIKNYLLSQNMQQIKQKINLEILQNDQFVKQLFKIMNTQIKQNNQLNSVAFNIVQIIFKKLTNIQYNDQVIQQAGNIIMQIEAEQEKMMKIITEKFQIESQNSRVYIQILNNLFQKKNRLQRRDLAYLSRESAQSCILIKVQPLIRKQIQEGNITNKSFLVSTLQLIGNICSQSANLIENINKTNQTIIPYLFSILQQTIHLPGDSQSIINSFNFLYNVSLLDGPIRNKYLIKTLRKYLQNIFTNQKFIVGLSDSNKGYRGQFSGLLNLMSKNINFTVKQCFKALVNSIIFINQEYKKLSILQNIQQCKSQENKIQVNTDLIIKILECDSKFVNLIRVIQKTNKQLINQFNSRSLFILFKSILDIFLNRDNVLLQNPLQSSTIRYTINQIYETIKEYNFKYNKIPSSNSILIQDQSNNNNNQIEPIILRFPQSHNITIRRRNNNVVQNIPNINADQIVEQHQAESQHQPQGLDIIDQEQNQNKQKQMINQSQEKQNQIYKQITVQKTRQQMLNYQNFDQYVYQEFIKSLKQLDIVIKLLSQRPNKNQLYKQITNSSLLNQYQKEYLQNFKNNSNNKIINFDKQIFKLMVNSSKLQRLFKFINMTLDVSNANFKLDKYQKIIQQFGKHVIFYLEIASYLIGTQIQKFMNDDQNKYLQTSKFPKNRLQTKTINIQQIKGNLQRDLNQGYTIYNVLLDSFLKTMSHNIASSFLFLKKHGPKHISFLNKIIIQPVQAYIQQQIIPILKPEITPINFQRFRQSLKMIIELFIFNQNRPPQRAKLSSKLLLAFYVNQVDLQKQNMFSILSKLSFDHDQLYNDEQEIYEDTKQNRWKKIKKGHLRLTFNKIKYLMAHVYPEQIQDKQFQQLQQTHPDFKKQQQKTFYLYSKIHKVHCQVIQQLIQKNYIKELLMSVSSHLAILCERVKFKKQLIYINYIFEDNINKQITKQQLDQQINQRNKQLFDKILNINNMIISIPMILKAIFDMNKPNQLSENVQFIQNIKDKFINISQKINSIYYQFTGNNIDTGFSLPNKIQKSKMNQQQEINLKIQIQNLTKLISFMIQFIRYFKANQFFTQGHPKITTNYIKDIVQFSSFLFENLQIQIHFSYQGDFLVQCTIRLIQQFISYKEEKEKFLEKKNLQTKIKKNQKKKSKNKKNKKKLKQLKNKLKQFDKESISNTSQIQSINQPIGKIKNKKNTQKTQKKKIRKQMKKNQIATNNQTNKKKKNNNLKEKQIPFNRSVTDFIKISLIASQQEPYLRAKTIQNIIAFLEKFAKDVVVKEQLQSNNKQKQNKIQKHNFFVYSTQLYSDLLKIKIKTEKADGFFYLLSFLSMKLITQKHSKIDLQCAIKRFFYQQKLKHQSNKNFNKQNLKVKMSQFQALLVQDAIIQFPDLSYLLNIVEVEIETKDSKRQEKLIIHEFNNKNYKKFLNQSDEKMFIALKNYEQLDLITLPSLKRRKESQIHQNDKVKKIKFYQYHPEGDFAAIICQIISHIIKILIKQIAVQCNDEQKIIETSETQKLIHFNLKILIYTLQVLFRQSPIIVPWVARFKCKKILINQLKNYKLSFGNQAYTLIMTYLYGQPQTQIEKGQQISFLTLLIKFIYPISQISTLLFEFGLDNNVLIQDKNNRQNNKQIKENQQNDKKYCPFGSMIRQKILQQIQSQLQTTKNVDQIFLQREISLSIKSLIVKKTSCMGMLTILLSIKQFAKICIQNNLIKKIQEQYLRTNKIVKKILQPNNNQIGINSSVIRNFMINYFIKPMQILQQLSIQYQISKKQNKNNFSNNRVHIKVLLTGDTINDQLFNNQILSKNSFKAEWLYQNRILGDINLENQMQGFDDQQMSELFASQNSQYEQGRELFDNSQIMDEQMPILQDNDQIQISGAQLLDQEIDEQNNDQWLQSEGLFERDSQDYQNSILYPDTDQILQEGLDEEDLDSDDINQEQLDHYDDSEQDQFSEGDIQFPQDTSEIPQQQRQIFGMNIIDQNQLQQQKSDEIRRVPKIGIYLYFNPPQPQRRNHDNHICNNLNSVQKKRIECLYDIFMDVVSFENIVITNQMVKLENQQALVIRKIFKILFYKKMKGKKYYYKQNLIKIQQEYFEDVFKIFNLDPMIKVAEIIDFRDCQKISQFIKAIPSHYVDIFQDQPTKYFNEFPKLTSRFKRRVGRNLPFQYMRRFNAPIRVAQQRNTQVRQHPMSVNNLQQSQQNPQNFIEPPAQENEPRTRIIVSIQGGNNRQINFHSQLDRILQNMGMNERQFLALPHDVQSDIIQQSIENGSLNIYLNRLINGQGSNIMPRIQIQHSESQQQLNQDNQILEPDSFIMDQNQNESSSQEDQNAQQNRMQQQRNNQAPPSTPIRQINENIQITPPLHINQQNLEGQNQIFPQRYRKISLQHSQKISKDIIQILNKDGRNDSKFNEISEQMLTQIIEQIFILQNRDFVRYSFSFLNMNMINSKNCSKIISTFIVLLGLYPSESCLDRMIQDRKSAIDLIKSKKFQNDIIPKIILRVNNFELIKDYQCQIYENFATKILHILQNLTKSYTISMQMLKTNNTPLKCLQKYIQINQQNSNLLSFEQLIKLLKCKNIYDNAVIVEYLLRIINNVISYYFQKNIYSIHQQKVSKNKIQSQNRIQTQNKSQVKKSLQIIPQTHKIQQQQNNDTIQMHKCIQLSDQSIQLLSNLLMSNDLRQNKNLSQLIMKLSINSKNLIAFIKTIQNILIKLSQKSIIFLNKSKNNESIENFDQSDLNNLLKIYCLLEIFNSMIKQFKDFTYKHNVQKGDKIISKFKSIVESQKLYQLCLTIGNLITQNTQRNNIMKTLPQVLQIFFLIFNINIQLSSNINLKKLQTLQQKEANKIAKLGQIKLKQKQFNNSDLFVSIDNQKFKKLWNQKVCSQNGKILINSIIKKKVSSNIKSKKLNKFSYYDIPIYQIALNSRNLLDFQNKKTIFKSQLRKLRKKQHYQKLYIQLERNHVFQQSFNYIMSKKPQQLKGQLKINFQGQEGLDAGGLTRQWFQLLSKQMFNPQYCLFKVTLKGTTYHPSSVSYVNGQHLNYFKFIGRIIGKALFDGYHLNAYFTPAFYKHILKIPITYEDLEEQDPQIYNSFKGILKYSPVQEYLNGFYFTYEYDNFGEKIVKQLVPGGQKIQITQKNKLQYIQLKAYALMATAIQSQLQSFLQGLHEIIPHKYLKIFDPKQLQMMISGLSTIDVVDLKRNTQYDGYTKNDKIITWFFQILQSYDVSHRTAFLQFLTGSSRVPTDGFQHLRGINGPQKFMIQKAFDINSLPTAHTCYNLLDLPPYPTKQILYKKLTFAIMEGNQGFYGFR